MESTTTSVASLQPLAEQGMLQWDDGRSRHSAASPSWASFMRRRWAKSWLKACALADKLCHWCQVGQFHRPGLLSLSASCLRGLWGKCHGLRSSCQSFLKVTLTRSLRMAGEDRTLPPRCINSCSWPTCSPSDTASTVGSGNHEAAKILPVGA